MIIGPGSTVIFHFDIKLSDGSAAESTRVHNKPAKLQMGDGSLSPAFEAQLGGMAAGDKRTFTLAPEDAYGMPNPDNIYYVDRSKFSADAPAKVGMIVGFAMPDGSELPGLIRDVVGESVTVDFNHPLAGQTLTFNVEIVQVIN
ncbi:MULTISPECIES: FKBP-type peptidyl-prolyl cis-trans isomerase [Rheinheimera]|uniref:Peptidyl-prolyl cis-trans isomerase n=1 Tax=Rheinheimera tangshanensis TaxID=400153 RepID=A0A5C8LVG7_9GAMM|nr:MULTISPECIES: FKBP-type peptidyl-prolyl cis-trans isomerase [Rheinheimera]KOO56879.1 peptidylprolyl isomerase [Rheinheimera sp. KL1]MBP8226584.1 FKBP-type peptidyl-prolyl cis-trans isomerase [Rheinheimera sp.]TXK81256.1 FKBP-type peptidyl-prolyl cis-trans isomerase [Rheinheimera tangshanensis]GGM59364.1 peptidyl-prolyl cis-trans isomerase [Rheinheimera tangshanensis]